MTGIKMNEILGGIISEIDKGDIYVHTTDGKMYRLRAKALNELSSYIAVECMN